ncbi:MAG: hypothetical protein J6Y98_04250 [Bacteroidales bacterium]|nr:hypothetical protein [Bacteroidales bacterium]
MNRKTRTTLLLVGCLLLATACSNRGIHMSKHRKSRKCNCPTFAENNDINLNTDTIPYLGVIF